MKPDVSFSLGTEIKIKSLTNPIEGRFYISEDTNLLFMAINGKNQKIGDIEIVKNDAERLAITSPLNKLYYVEETGDLWRYTSAKGWDKYLTSSEALKEITDRLSGETQDIDMSNYYTRFQIDEMIGIILGGAF